MNNTVLAAAGIYFAIGLGRAAWLFDHDRIEGHAHEVVECLLLWPLHLMAWIEQR